MRCLGEFKNDRTCDLCQIANLDGFIKCKKIHDDKIVLSNKLRDIIYRCSNSYIQHYDEEKSYYACKLLGNKYKNECKCTLECEKYCKGE